MRKAIAADVNVYPFEFVESTSATIANDDSFTVDPLVESEVASPADYLQACSCGSVESFHYCYSGLSDFVGPNAGAWAKKKM